MFDAAFYQTVFPQLLQQECRRQSGKVPIVEFRLGDGTTLDICHVIQPTDRWMVVAFFRDPKTCEDMDLAFLPYEMVVRIGVSFHDPKLRRIGFTLPQPVSPTAPSGHEIGIPGESK